MKKSTLDLLRAIVTFTVSSLNASSSGEGRKSSTTSTSSIGPALYFLLALIDSLTPSPVAGSKDANDVLSVGEADGHNAVAKVTKAKESLFASRAVSDVSGDDSMRISEGILCFRETDTVLALVLSILPGIPIEARHPRILAKYGENAISGYGTGRAHNAQHQRQAAQRAVRCMLLLDVSMAIMLSPHLEGANTKTDYRRPKRKEK